MDTKLKVNSTILSRVVNACWEFTVIGAGSAGGDATLTFDPGKASAANRARAMMHGWKQRVGDGGAIEREAKTDDGGVRRRTDAEMAAIRLERMKAIIDHYETGSDDWAIRVAVAKGPDAGLTIRGMIRAGLAADVDTANGMIDRIAAKRGIERSAALRVWADSDKVVAAIIAIKAEASTVSSDDLAAELAEVE